MSLWKTRQLMNCNSALAAYTPIKLMAADSSRVTEGNTTTRLATVLYLYPQVTAGSLLAFVLVCLFVFLICLLLFF